MLRWWPPVLGTLTIAIGAYAARTAQAAGYDRPAKNATQSRSVVVAEHGIVATSQPLAAQAGLDILKRGGNAADAAIATNAMLGLVEPMSCGIGGDLFVIYWDAKTQKLYGLNASGRSPYKLEPRRVQAEGAHRAFPARGRCAGRCRAAWPAGKICAAASAASRWPRCWSRRSAMPKRAFRSARSSPATGERSAAGLKKLARHGQDVSDRRPRAGRGRDLSQSATWPPAIGRSPRTGRTRSIKGAIAQKIVAFSEANGGYFSLKDFADHTRDWVEPVSTNYRGYDVWELPPNGQGIAALQMLNLLEPYDVRKMGRGSAEWLHLFVEAKKLAFADRAKFYADPGFRQAADRGADLEGVCRQARQADRACEQAAKDVPPGDPLLAARRHDLPDRRRQGPQLLLVHSEQFRRLRLARRAGRRGLRDAESRPAVRPGRHAPQPPGAAQAAVPHDHSGDGHQGRQAVAVASA